MAVPVIIPQYGTSVDRVVVRTWLKREGEPIQRGDLICELETDKATTELEAFAEGVLVRQLVEEGDEAQIGQIIAYIGEVGEEVPEEDEGALEQSEADEQPEMPTVKGPAQPRHLSTVMASPATRKVAKKLGVDLSQLTGTGAGGKVTREDVLMAEQRSQEMEPIPSSHEEALSANQLSVLRRITQSHREIIPISLTSRIDMTGTLRERERLQSELGRKVSLDAFFVHAVAATMKEFPRFRSQLSGESLVVFDDINVGVAVSEDENLFIPVVRRADHYSVAENDDILRRLIQKAHDGKLAPEDVTDATVTVSNLGMYPVDAFTAIIPPDQSAALAIGTIQRIPLAGNSGEVIIQPVVRVVLSVDHRFINGREAGSFLAILKKRVEEL